MAMSRVRGASAAVIVFLAVLAATSLTSLPSRAADPLGRFSVSLRFGSGAYRFGAINQGIARSAERLRHVEEAHEWKMPGQVDHGFEVVGDAAYDINDRLRVGFNYGNLWASSGVDYIQTIEIRPRATTLTPRLLYKLPWRPMVDMSLRAFAGPVFLRGAETKIEHENTSENSPRLDSMTIKGSGIGFIGGVVGEYTLSDRFTLSFDAAYRQAKASFDSGSWTITKLTDPLSNNTEVPPDALPNNRDLPGESYLWGFLAEPFTPRMDREPTVREDLDTDFSGFVLAASLRVYLF